MTTIFIAEDQEMLNTALTTILNLEDDFNVIGSATDGQTALENIQHLKPDIVILDIEMPKLTGLDVAKLLRSSSLDCKIIIITTFSLERYFKQAIAAQVEGYLLKDSPSETLIRAIRTIIAGDTVYSPELVSHLISPILNPLTERELVILERIGNGCATEEVAQQLYLSNGTIRNYISAILSKTGTRSRIEAINIAKENNWL